MKANGMNVSRLATLLEKAMQKAITPAERDELFALLADLDNKQTADEALAVAWEDFRPKENVFPPDESAEILKEIMVQHRAGEIPVPGDSRSINLRRWLAIAASAVVVASVAIYLFLLTDVTEKPRMTLAEAAAQAGIEPGTDRATITLGNGRTLELDGVVNGLMAEEAGVRIQKLADGQISYESASQHTDVPGMRHTITIPKGGQYQLELPDGSMVHLNSESTLTYPVRFTGHERTVELEGEAFFEVRKYGEGESSADGLAGNKRWPFKVVTNDQVIEVLGTKFNVYAYRDSDVRTTLAEGSVKVSNMTGLSALLKPGEVAVLDKNNDKFSVKKANLNIELAWHNGYFLFDDERIESIMERVARWYNVDVEYHGDLSGKRFGGIFQRSKSISQLLESFRETGLIEFTIEERRVIVMGK